MTEDEEAPRPRAKKRKGSIGQSIGGVLFGFEQQVFRNVPPPHELVHQARPDDPVPAGDGTFVTFELPDDDVRDATSDGDPATDDSTAPADGPEPDRA